ncbi:hypothetical protein [Maricaulis sp.]|jgi:hypothetical protein|nr:hypothetical protein [Maricaulis sp.]
MADFSFEQASQAEKGHGVRWVLGLSLAFAVIALFLFLAAAA